MPKGFRSILVAYEGRWTSTRQMGATFLHGVTRAAAMETSGTAVYGGELEFVGQHLASLPVLYPGLAGVIVHRSAPGAKLLVKALGKKTPILLYGSSAYSVNGPAPHWVATDEEEVVRRALEHLFQMGHRRIGLISRVTAAHRRREVSWRKWMAARKLPIAPKAIFEVPVVNQSEAFDDPRQVKTFLDKVTGVFAVSDMDLPPLMRAAEGLAFSLPRDLSLVGVDNSDFCIHMRPTLTSVDLDQSAAGTQCFEAMYRIWRGETAAIHEFAPVSFSERQSVTVPRALKGKKL